MKIEVCLLSVSDSVAFAVDCTVSRTVIQLFTQSLVTCFELVQGKFECVICSLMKRCSNPSAN